jgi:hypothetical protein
MPAVGSAFDVVVNRRNSVDQPPTVDAGADQTFDYASQFGEGLPSVSPIAGDADLHALTYEWRENGRRHLDGPRAADTKPRAWNLYVHRHRAATARAAAPDTVRVTITPTTEIVRRLRRRVEEA